MKREQKENVRITTIAFGTNHTAKENVLFSFVVPFLSLFLAVAGLTGSFATAFSVQTTAFLLYWGLFFISLFWTIFSKRKMDGIYSFLAFIGAMVVASILLLFMQDKVIPGFFQVANGIFETFNASYESNIALYQVTENPLYVSIFLLFVMFPVSGLLSFVIIKRQNVWCLVAVVFPLISGAFLSGGSPEALYLFLMLLSLLGLWVEGVVAEPFPLEYLTERKSQERHYQEIKSKVMLGSLIPITFVSAISFFLLQPAILYPVNQVREMGAKTEDSILQTIWRTLPVISGGRLQMSVEGVGGGVDEGTLGKTEGHYFGSVQALKVNCGEKPAETLYLKGYVGCIYTGNSFDAGSEERFLDAAEGWKTEGNSSLYVQNLPFLRMLYAENLILSDTEDGPQMAEELQASAVEMQVINLNANQAYTYVPYNSYLNDYYRILAGDGAVASQSKAEDIFSYYPRSAFEEKMAEWKEQEDAHGVLDSLEAAYESYVVNTYLQVPEKGLEQLWAECEAVELEEVEEIREHVVKTLTEKASFQMDVEPLPEGEDFVSRFLYEEQEGYSTHFAAAATMMFRMLGVPARYVVGYVAPESLFSVQADGSYQAILEDDDAHAWAEIYISGIGWVPVETTPGLVAIVAEGNGDVDAEAANRAEKEEPETEELPEPQETDGKKVGFSGQLVVGIFCICVGGTIIIAFCRREILIQKRAGKQRKPDTAGNIKYVYRSFRSLLAFDGWAEAPGCEAEEFTKLFTERYPVCSEEEMESFAMIILKTYYGCDRPDREELQFLTRIYKRVGNRIYRRSTIGKRLKFKWWNCYM
ncbi:MAG: transglutaminase domain-containing protein [Lachnospiraceae bacterium]|nr:transglutaminase domain-containing protein [Lachnospiraceae bacterium]